MATAIDRKVVGVAGFLLTGLILAYIVGILTLQKIMAVTVFGTVMAALYFAVQKEAFNQVWDDIEDDTPDTPIAQALTEQEAREKIKAWSRESYKGDGQIRFRFSGSDTRTVKLHWPNGDIELVRAYYTPWGEDRKEVIVFIECVSGRILDHIHGKWGEMPDDPFKYCDYVREYRQERRLRAWENKPARRRKKSSRSKPTQPRDTDEQEGEQ